MAGLRFGWGFFRDLIDWSNTTVNTYGAAQVKAAFLQLAFNKPAIKTPVINRTAKAVNTTGAISAADLSGGLITSTSAAGVTVTLPTATLLATQIGATRGTTFDFVVDNSAGANTVTVAVNTGIAVATPAVTGGATLTVSTANVIGYFRLTFTSATTAVLSRIA